MKNLFFTLLAVILWIPICFLNANMLTVPSNYPTIQSAINSAVNGDTILVSPGIYNENINFRGKGILLTSYYLINHDTSYITNTVINGGSPVHNDTASCIIMTKPNISYASDTSAAIIGFTLTGGRGTVWEDSHYPGYFYREGGAIFIQYWSPRIRYNRIIANNIQDSIHPDGGGGGIRCCDGNPIIENNVIQNNFGYCGTAINLYFSSGIVRNNIVAGNYGGRVWGSGAIYVYGNFQSKPVVIVNNTVVNNSATNGCGGLRLYLSNSVTVKNNIVRGNLPIQIYQSGGSVTYTYCNVQGGWSGSGNIDLNPQFVGNTYFLNSTSPCIDAGDTSISCRDPENPLNPGYALWPAQGTVRNDMGVFGGSRCSVIGSSVIGVKNSEIKVKSFSLFQNYPNPFNPNTTIRFLVYRKSLINIRIYDLLGKELFSFVNEVLQPGEYEVKFSVNFIKINSLSSGAYFYSLFSDGNLFDTKKMIIMK